MLALSLLAFITMSLPAFAQEFQIPPVILSGGDLEGSIHLAPADADAFRRRVVQPPRLDETPNVSGLAYTVISRYWASAVRLEDDEESGDVELEAAYYQDGGYVRVGVGSEDVWMVLDLRQRAILDRYIWHSLQSGSALGEQPSTMDMLALIVGQEALGVEVAGQAVGEDKATELIIGLARANPAPLLEPRQPPAGDHDGFWLTVTLLEGRTLRYFYDGETLTEWLGTERYDASAVAPALEELRPADLPGIQHEEPVGSLLWWPVTVGGGLLAIGVALWLRRQAGQ